MQSCRTRRECTVGTIYVADKGNNRTRKLFSSSHELPTPAPRVTPTPSFAPTDDSSDYFIETIASNSSGDIKHYSAFSVNAIDSFNDYRKQWQLQYILFWCQCYCWPSQYGYVYFCDTKTIAFVTCSMNTLTYLKLQEAYVF